MRALVILVALSSLVVCLAAPALYFQGGLSEESMKLVFLLASVVWFISAVAWSTSAKTS